MSPDQQGEVYSLSATSTSLSLPHPCCLQRTPSEERTLSRPPSVLEKPTPSRRTPRDGPLATAPWSSGRGRARSSAAQPSPERTARNDSCAACSWGRWGPCGRRANGRPVTRASSVVACTRVPPGLMAACKPGGGPASGTRLPAGHDVALRYPMRLTISAPAPTPQVTYPDSLPASGNRLRPVLARPQSGAHVPLGLLNVSFGLWAVGVPSVRARKSPKDKTAAKTEEEGE